MKIRASIATASVLGLKPYALAARTTTLYLMLSNACSAGCRYCTQQKGYLSRVKWPVFQLHEIRHALKNADAYRLCIQCPINKNTVSDALKVVQALDTSLPISLSIGGLAVSDIKTFRETGIDRLGIGLDCATKLLFGKWKQGTLSYRSYLKTVYYAKRIFGHATCHLMIGLGETDRELISMMNRLARKDITVALFAYFDGKKTAVSLPRYRAMQLACTHITQGTGKFMFNREGRLIKMIIPHADSHAFITKGCPWCNRPFYNERVTSIYNYPYFPKENETERALTEAHAYANVCIAAE